MYECNCGDSLFVYSIVNIVLSTGGPRHFILPTYAPKYIRNVSNQTCFRSIVLLLASEYVNLTHYNDNIPSV